MPRGAPPPTPASSTDIQGQDGSKQLASLHMAFELPPPAVDGRVSPATSLDTDINMMTHLHDPDMAPPLASTKRSSSSATSPSSKAPYPMQAAEAVKSRRRSSALQAQTQENASASPSGKDAFALPPPPTRSRKIIQMKPRMKDKAEASAPSSTGKPGRGAAAAAVAQAVSSKSTTAASTAAAASTEAVEAAGSKKKQPSSTSAAGRRTARKTAHSLIERRRRSKMNEEFAVLKGMVPACTGEMHKLAILQASIEYVRYLEDCVATLKAQRESEQQHGQQYGHASGCPSLSPRAMPQHGSNTPRHSSRIYMDEDAVSPDVEMAGTSGQGEEEEEEEGDEDEAQSQQYYNSQYRPQQDSRHNSHSSNASSTRYSPNLSAAVAASLAAAAADHNAQQQQRHHYSSFSYTSGAGLGGFTTSAQTSPAFGPQQHPLPPLPASATASPFLYGQSSSAAATPLLGARAGADNMHGGTLSAAPSISGSALTSPALAPQRDMDQEATAALLMLNSDRRGNAGGRGMSVQDLLST